MDFGIILIIALLVLNGFKDGLVRKLAQIFGIILGLLASASYYPLASNFFIEHLNVSTGIADTLSFVFIFLMVYALIISVGALIGLITRFKPIRVLDRAGGAVVGFVLGVIVSGAILLVATTFPIVSSYDVPVGESRFGTDAIQIVEGVYQAAESSFSLNLPRLAFNPEEMSYLSEENPLLPDYRLLDFSKLEGSTCIDCSGTVEFLGYLRTDQGAISPKFACGSCGRTSDGCQTYEGHHLLYDRCPAEMGRKGYRTDCGMWSNGNFIRVTGTCTVCGESGR